MKVLIDGKEYNLSPDSSGLVKITFTKETKDAIEIGELEDCNGTTLIDEIQIEHGDQVTPYEDPNLILGNATGLIKEIRGIEYAISDPKTGLRSQITMLAQGFEQEVSDAIGNYSVQGQTVDGLFAEISKVNGNVNRIIQNADGTSQLITNLNNDYQSLKSTANLYERIIGSTGDGINQNISRIIQTSDVIQTEVAKMDLATNTALTSKISQLADNINLKVSNADLLSQINVQAGDVLITSGTNKLNVTPTTTYIEDGTIKSAMIASLEADKITTGTLDAGKVKVVNLDANNITANKTEFIQSNWNAVNAFTQIDASGIQMLGSGAWRRTFLSPTGFRLFNGVDGSNKSGAIGYFKSIRDLDGLSNPLKEDFMWQTQQRHAIGIGVNETHLLTLGYQLPGAGNSDGYNPALTIDPQKNGQVTISTDARVNLGLQVNGSLTLPGGDVFTNYNGLYLNTSYWTVMAKTGVRFFVGDQKKLHIGGNVELGTTLDMAGNAITGQSDCRLKKDIETLNSNDLDKLTGVRMVSYKWIDPERPKGTHVGFIAQELQEVYPEFITENDDGILSINNSELAMAHIHATQELNAKVDSHISNVDNEVAKLKAQVASLQDELAQLKGD